MTTQVNTKVRLVRCPKCRKLLAELPDVPVYQCGGCGTILEAKRRRQESNSTESSPQEPDSVANSQQDNALGLEAARGSNHDSPKAESLLERSVSDGFSSSPGTTCPGGEDSPVKAKESPEHDLAVQNCEGYQSDLRADRGEPTVGPTFSDELPSSCEITLEDEAYTTHEHVDQSQLHQDNGVDQKEDRECERVKQESDNLVDDAQNLSEHEDQESVLPENINDNYAPLEKDEKIRNSSGDQNVEFNGGITCVELPRENDFEGPSGGDSILASRTPLNGSRVSFYLTSEDEHLDHSHSEVTRDFERVGSIDTLGSSHLADLTSVRQFRHGSMSNFPTNGSYYAYDGSESSYDGADDQIQEHISHPLRKNNRRMDSVRTTECLRKDGFRGNNLVNSETERTYWETSSTHRAMKSSQWTGGITAEANRSTSGHWMRPDGQGDVSGHRMVRTSDYWHHMLPPRPGVNVPNKPSYAEPDSIDLLRTVYELKDQLNRLHFPRGTSNRMSPFLYDHYHAEGCAERYNLSRLAFSGEAARYRHHAGRSCLHCHPQDWHYSEQLPSSLTDWKNGHSVVPTDHYTSSELSLWGCESRPDDQRLDEMKRLRLREKYQAARRHLLPVAGGAPFVTCYHCSELLQLPADFLLFEKRCHRLMCNACKKVLKFSVLRGTCIVPYVKEAAAPPRSESADCNNAPGRRNEKSQSQSSFCQHVEPVSYSDDFGRSFCRSCSTEGEREVLDQVGSCYYDRKISSGSSYELMEDRKMKGILVEPANTNEGSPNSVESAGPSWRSLKLRNGTSEIEEVPTSSNSPLHRLMGYSSPSQVLNR